MAGRKHFTREFKQEAVRLLEQGQRPAAAIARELGIPRNRLYKWQAQLAKEGATAFPGSGRRAGPAEELARLKRELERVKEERDILKKAAAYFARESGEVPLHPRAAGRLPHRPPVPRPRGQSERLLRVGAAARECAGAGESAARRPDA